MLGCVGQFQLYSMRQDACEKDHDDDKTAASQTRHDNG